MRFLLAALCLTASCFAQRDPSVAATVLGRVIDPDGQPVAAAEVTGSGGRTVQTDDAGRFRLTVGPAAGFSLATIRAPGRVAMVVSGRARTRQLQLGDVVLPRASALAGVVRDADGKPLPGVRVTAIDMFAENQWCETWQGRVFHRDVTTTDARGVFRFRHALALGMRLICRKTGFYDEQRPGVSKLTPLTITMRRGGEVTGEVRDASGKPLAADLSVTWEAMPFGAPPVRSKADGTFRFNLAAPGRYRIRVPPRPGAATRLLSPILAGPQRGVVVQPPADFAKSGAGIARVAAKESETGKPIAGGELWVFGYPSTSTAGFLASRRPRHRVPVPSAAVVQLGAMSPRGGDVLLRSPGFAPAKVQARGDGTKAQPELLEFELDPESAVQGVVYDAQRRPLAGVEVWSIYLGPRGQSSTTYGAPPPNRVRTGKDGRFRLGGLPRGHHAVQVYAPGRALLPASHFVLRRGQVMKGVELRLPRGTPIAGTLTGLPDGYRFAVRSERVRTGPRRSAARFRPPSAQITWLAQGAKRFALPAQGAQSKLELTLFVQTRDRFVRELAVELGTVGAGPLNLSGASVRPARVAGKVQLPGARGIRDRLVVVAFPVLAPGMRGRLLRARALSRAALVGLDGKYALTILPGVYRFFVVDLLTGLRLLDPGERIEIGAGAQVSCDLTGAPGRVDLELSLDGEWDSVLAQVNVERESPDGLRVPLAHVLPRQIATPGVPLQPGQMRASFYVSPGALRLSVRHRATYLRDAMSFTEMLGGGDAVEVVAGQAETVKLRIQPPASTKELMGN